jgi:hypothetical protein
MPNDIKIPQALTVSDVDYFLTEEKQRITLADLDKGTSDNIDKVYWLDGSWSWAKCWFMRYPDGFKVVRVGAGAAGNLRLWPR